MNSYNEDIWDVCTACLNTVNISNIHAPTGECGACRKASCSSSKKIDVQRAIEIYAECVAEVKEKRYSQTMESFEL
jgi:hypothetical protein